MCNLTKNDISAFSQGDTKAFEKLFLLYYPRVKVFVDSILNDADTAEDLAQDTFVQLWRYRAGMAGAANPNAYIYQTAKHILFAHIRRQMPACSLDSAADRALAEETEAAVLGHELEQLMECAISRMPPQRRQVFCMSRKEGLSNDEISRRLNISKRTVETHISAALATLRKVTTALALLATL